MWSHELKVCFTFPLQKNATEQALVQTALFYWHLGDHSKARTYVQKAAEYSDEYICATTLRGWIDLTCDRHMYVEKSVQFFDAVLSESPDGPADPTTQATNARNSVEAVMGTVAYLELKKNYLEALELLNRFQFSFHLALHHGHRCAPLLRTYGTYAAHTHTHTHTHRMFAEVRSAGACMLAAPEIPPDPKAVHQCARGGPASEAKRTLDSWFP